MGEADKAYDRALHFLEKRDRTEQEVYGCLAKAGFSEAAVSEAIGRLRDGGYVNDADYAARYMEALAAKGRGRLRIAAEMRRKGLSDELVRNTLEDGRLAEDERERAAAAARKAWAEMPEGTDGRKAALKVSRRLVTLGFAYDVIGAVMSESRTASRPGGDENVDSEEWLV